MRYVDVGHEMGTCEDREEILKLYKPITDNYCDNADEDTEDSASLSVPSEIAPQDSPPSPSIN